jgi:hypothetical protein
MPASLQEIDVRAFFLLLSAALHSCEASSPLAQACRKQYERCADEAKSWPEYVSCRERVDKECLR